MVVSKWPNDNTGDSLKTDLRRLNRRVICRMSGNIIIADFTRGRSTLTDENIGQGLTDSSEEDCVMHGCAAKLVLITLFAGWSLSAQDKGATIQEARQSYDYARDNILKSAQEMPQNAYSFRPTPANRTFAELIEDAARSQAEVCAAVIGTSPEPDVPFLQNKTDLIVALRRSASECDAAYASVNRFNAGNETGLGNMRHTKLGLLFLNAAHQQQLYGEISVYLDLKGLTPPSRSVRPVPVD